MCEVFCAQYDELKNISYSWTEQVNFPSNLHTKREEMELFKKKKKTSPNIHQ